MVILTRVSDAKIKYLRIKYIHVYGVRIASNTRPRAKRGPPSIVFLLRFKFTLSQLPEVNPTSICPACIVSLNRK